MRTVSLLLVVIAAIFAACFAQEQKFDTNSVLALTAGTTATVTLDFNPDVCTYSKFDYPIGTAAITVDVVGPTGTTWLDTTLLINGFPLSYRNYHDNAGYGDETSSGERYSICTGTNAPCDYNVPDLHEAAGTLYICTARWSSGETTAATATVTVNAVPLLPPTTITATGYTFTNTMPAVPADYEYFGYWITLTKNVTSYDVTTSGSDVRLYFPTLYSSSAWGTGNTRNYPDVGTYPVLIQVASGAGSTDITMTVEDDCTTGGFGSNCLTPNVTTVGANVSTTIEGYAYHAYSLAIPSSAAGSVAVTLEFGVDLGYEFSVYYTINGQVAGSSSMSASYFSGSTNVTIHGVPVGADFHFTIRNDYSTAITYNMIPSIHCDSCTRGTCDAATYTCTCPTGLWGDNCNFAVAAASVSEDVTVSITDALVYGVVATFTADEGLHYRINVSLSEGYNFNSFWVLDETTGQIVVPIVESAEAFSIFVPHQSLTAGSNYHIITAYTTSTRPLTYTINLTTAQDSNSASAFGFNPVFIALVALIASILALF